MSGARLTEVIAVSKVSFGDASAPGVARARETLKNVKSVWIQDQSVDVEKGKIVGYKLSLKATFVPNDRRPESSVRHAECRARVHRRPRRPGGAVARGAHARPDQSRERIARLCVALPTRPWMS
jgi:hypothetical protein